MVQGLRLLVLFAISLLRSAQDIPHRSSWHLLILNFLLEVKVQSSKDAVHLPIFKFGVS
jgi:hypothetical protein